MRRKATIIKKVGRCWIEKPAQPFVEPHVRVGAIAVAWHECDLPELDGALFVGIEIDTGKLQVPGNGLRHGNQVAEVFGRLSIEE